MPAENKITFGEMREMGVRGLLIYCSDYHCSHSIVISADRCRMMSGSPTSSRVSSAERAASAVLTFGRSSSRRDKGISIVAAAATEPIGKLPVECRWRGV
jgi:hypothetical protein